MGFKYFRPNQKLAASRSRDIVDLDLCVTLTRPWPQCRTVLLEVAPRILFDNQTNIDLWLIANGRQWMMDACDVFMAPSIEVSLLGKSINQYRYLLYLL